ncbi:similar to C50H11.1, isoform CRA_b [Rattus norvegicus]|uniref:Similar to C50H11.1, isoform CRA_b n=1 Tax=Rattus norvegicus TaxID=10116 RepID=A6IZU2_RAT|nr:similar to C50H11.1, isoform CRA_b [Rattus norvegicus]
MEPSPAIRLTRIKTTRMKLPSEFPQSQADCLSSGDPDCWLCPQCPQWSLRSLVCASLTSALRTWLWPVCGQLSSAQGSASP